MLATKTYKQPIWLRKFGHIIPKRTLLWSNSALIRKLDWGKLHQSERGGDSGVRTYIDAKGRKRVVGSAKLKATQLLDCIVFYATLIMTKEPAKCYSAYFLRKYPVKYARAITDMIPLFRNGPPKVMPDEAARISTDKPVVLTCLFR